MTQLKQYIETPLRPPSSDYQGTRGGTPQRTGIVVPMNGTDVEIYKRLKPLHLRSRPVPQKDENGRILRRTNAAGITIQTPHYEREMLDESDPAAWEFFYMMSMGTGLTKLVRFDPEEYERSRDRRRREDGRVTLLDRLSTALAEADVDPDEFVRRIVEKSPAPVVKEEGGAVATVRKNGAWWSVYGPDGEKVGDSHRDRDSAIEAAADAGFEADVEE